jgi:hypothetical protein
LGIQRDSTSGKYTPLGECDATGGTMPPVISGQLFRFTLPNAVFVDSFEGIIII